MPFLLLKLLGIGRWLKEAATALFRAILAHPKEAAIIALCASSLWLFRGRQAARVEAARWETAFGDQKLTYERASKEAAALALAQVKAVEAKSAQLAKDADHAHELAQRDARDATARFAAAHRVRPNQVCRSDAPAPAEGNDPGLPADLPPDPLVAIREPDLQALVEWATVGIEAHNLSVDKVNAGLAKVPEGWPEPDFGAAPRN